eukprot:GHVU01015271.1.p1 GENE.GHVU01015271.1~~GHVU01015271.1.p1  ORF type:complete len:142 (-),score=5.88 GHVU01015271.1:32-457(-)
MFLKSVLREQMTPRMPLGLQCRPHCLSSCVVSSSLVDATAYDTYDAGLAVLAIRMCDGISRSLFCPNWYICTLQSKVWANHVLHQTEDTPNHWKMVDVGSAFSIEVLEYMFSWDLEVYARYSKHTRILGQQLIHKIDSSQD